MNGNTAAAIVLLIGIVIVAVNSLTWLQVRDRDKRGAGTS